MRNVIVQRDVVKSGVGFGSALAMVISYTAYKSVLWAIIHGLFGWFYVVYFLIMRQHS
jgi:ABC-type Fe3+-siderophore transport system permease subunit